MRKSGFNSPFHKRRHSKQTAEYQYLYKTARWRRMSKDQLKAHPFCQCPHCNEKPTSIASLVDHIVPHKGDKKKFFDKLNLMSMNRTCHNRFKASEEMGGFGFMKGCDEQGQPLNKNHWWYAETATEASRLYRKEEKRRSEARRNQAWRS